MDMYARAAKVAERLANGRLPKTKSMKLWAGFGKGKTCDGCGDLVMYRDVEHEHDMEAGPALRFHAACSVLWARMVAARPPAA
jgi:hypothetical protein